MGTSKSFETPAGGAWTRPKRQLTTYVTGGAGGDLPFDAQVFVYSAMAALGGVGIKPRLTNGPPSASSADRGIQGTTPLIDGHGSAGGVGALSSAVRNLGGFGAQVSSEGLDAALNSLGLRDLRGRPAAEVIAQVAEHLSRNGTGKQTEILEAALRDTIFDIAAAEGTGSYEDLEGALQGFINREGLEGFVELFLSQYVFTAVWSYFENHAQRHADGAVDPALASAVESACRSVVSNELKDFRSSQKFESVDWFGATGKQFADGLVEQLQRRLTQSD
jgi:hypothetical protein